MPDWLGQEQQTQLGQEQEKEQGQEQQTQLGQEQEKEQGQEQENERSLRLMASVVMTGSG